MILLDVNVLVNASRTDGDRHEEFRSWFLGLQTRGEPFAVSDHILVSVVRITTNRRIFEVPSTVDAALEYCRVIREAPSCRVVAAQKGFWRELSRLVLESGAKGPMVTDAEIAAIALEHGCTLATADRDFARFPGLRWFHPLEDMSITMNPRRK